MEDFTLLKFGLADIPELTVLSESVGWPNTQNDWKTTFAAGKVFGHRDRAGALISSAAIYPYGNKLAAVGMVLVRKDHQRRGLGVEVMRRCLALLPTPAPPVFLVATEAGVPLYRKLGFLTVDHVHRFKSSQEVAPLPTPAGLELAPLREADFEAVRRLDAEVYGADRVTLLRARIAQAAGGAVLRRADGSLAGYGLKVLQGELLLLGPIIAPDDEAALALITGLAAGHPGPSRVDIPSGKPGLLERVPALGFTRLFAAPVMLLNAEKLPGHREPLFGFLSTAFG